jgi:hypothetical protein
MSTATLSHTQYAPRTMTRPGTPQRLSRAGWTHFRQAITIGVFVIATVAGIAIGVAAPEVSPVAPALADAQIAAPAIIPAAPAAPADNGAGRRGGNPAGPGGHR